MLIITAGGASSFIALSAAPTGGMFKHPGLNSKYNLFCVQLAGAVCEKYNTGYVMSVSVEGRSSRVATARQFTAFDFKLYLTLISQHDKMDIWQKEVCLSEATENWSQTLFLHSQISFSLWGPEAWNNVCSSSLPPSFIHSRATFTLVTSIWHELCRQERCQVHCSLFKGVGGVLNCSIQQVIIVRPGCLEEDVIKGKQRLRILYGFNLT